MKNILVPVDGSTFPEHALALALGLALGSGARLQLATVHAPPTAELQEFEILRVAEEADAGLIAVGTRGAGAIGRMLIGSVADEVVRGSTHAVLVCHSGIGGSHGQEARALARRGSRAHVMG